MQRHGFTLIELLVVMSIIAILAGLLLPAIGQVRQSANMTNAGSNLRQVFTSIYVYANDEGNAPAATEAGLTADLGQEPTGVANDRDRCLLHLARWVRPTLAAKVFVDPLKGGKCEYVYGSDGLPTGFRTNLTPHFAYDFNTPFSALGDGRRVILGLEKATADGALNGLTIACFASEGRWEKVEGEGGSANWTYINPEFSTDQGLMVGDDIYEQESGNGGVDFSVVNSERGSATMAWLRDSRG